MGWDKREYNVFVHAKGIWATNRLEHLYGKVSHACVYKMRNSAFELSISRDLTLISANDCSSRRKGNKICKYANEVTR